ncbi:hypothetical protein K2Q16_02970 [Patescibacteria group bacterium]|nr:hypothetical protein [Patescibacteria group bacterium]
MFKSPPSRLKKITRRSAPWALLCCSLIVLTLLARTELTPPSSQGLGAQVAGADASLPGGIGSWFGRTVAQVDGVWQFSAQVIQSVLSVDSVPSIASPSTATSTPASSNERTSATRPTFTDRASSLQINVPLLLEQGLTVRGLSTTLGTTTIEAPLTVLGVSRMSSVVATGNVDAGSLTSTNVTVSGAAALAQATVSGSLGVQGMLEATGGVVTRGATIDLGTGELFASNVVNRVRGGSNVRITGPANAPTVSFIAEEFSGVESINGESGDVDFSGGEGIAVNGTVISSVDTLALVRARGGCVDCVTDTDVSNVLTLSGGSIDGVVIGSTTRAGSFFSSIVVGSSTFNSNALAVEGSAVINDVVSVLGTATSTFGGTVNLTGGCFSINGVCVGGTDITYTGLLDTPNTLIAASIPFVNATGSVLTQSADFTYDGTRLSVSTSTTATTLVVGGSATIGNVLNVSGAATSTFGGTVNLTSGCFSINGVCVTNAGTVTSVNLGVPTGFTTAGGPVTTSGTLTLGYAAGYEGFLSASGTNWNSFYNTPSTRITAGSGLSWSGNTLNAAAGTIYLATTTTWTNGFLARVASNGTVDSVATSSLGLSAAFANSAQLAALLSDETGTGQAVFNNAPTFTGTSTFNGIVATNITATGTLAAARITMNGDSITDFTGVGLYIESNGALTVATGSLGLGGGTVTSVNLGVPTGFTTAGGPVTTSGTLTLGYAAGYEGFLSASGTNWNSFYNTPSTRITAGSGLSWSGNTLNAAAGTIYLATTTTWTNGFLARVASNGTVDSVSTSSLAIALSDTTGTLAANRGGTGVSALGGIGTILYTSAVNTLATSSLFVFTGTNLGVGTSTPSTRLDVWGNLRVGTSSTPLLFADTAVGAIGIGTAAPQAPVHVVGGNSFGQQIRVEDPFNAFVNARTTGGTGRAGYYMEGAGQLNNWYMIAAGETTDRYLLFKPTNNINDGTVSPLMMSGVTGNVGISSTIGTPARLTVMGAGTTTGLLAQLFDSAGVAKVTL